MRKFLVSIGLMFIIVSSGAALYLLWVARADSKAYFSLRPGMELTEVENLFERPPDYTCRLGDISVAYYFSRFYSFFGALTGLATGSSDVFIPDISSLPKKVSSPCDLPEIYSASQLLIDERGRLKAFIRIGEDLGLHTSQGLLTGKSLCEAAVEIGLQPLTARVESKVHNNSVVGNTGLSAVAPTL
jgi:hypothetical protein